LIKDQIPKREYHEVIFLTDKFDLLGPEQSLKRLKREMIKERILEGWDYPLHTPVFPPLHVEKYMESNWGGVRHASNKMLK